MRIYIIKDENGNDAYRVADAPEGVQVDFVVVQYLNADDWDGIAFDHSKEGEDPTTFRRIDDYIVQFEHPVDAGSGGSIKDFEAEHRPLTEDEWHELIANGLTNFGNSGYNGR